MGNEFDDKLDESPFADMEAPPIMTDGKRINVATAARRSGKTAMEVIMGAGARARPMDIEWLLKNGIVVDVDQPPNDPRYVVKIDWEALDGIFNELGMMLKSDDVDFTAEDQEKLCNSFLVLTNMMAEARTKTLARFGDD